MKNKLVKDQQQNVATGLNINWFPGHMKKGTDQIIKVINSVDLIIEVLDARAIKSSTNYELINLAKNKPILHIALKADYSTFTSHQNDVLVGSIKDYKFKNVIINAINAKLAPKLASYQVKGLVKPKFSILVVGLPNIGKSSLINFLKARNTLQVKNMPGVTKSQQVVAINDTLNLIDTPGILVKHITDITIAYKLMLINCIKKEVVTLEPVLEFGFKHYFLHHHQAFLAYYNLTTVSDYTDFMYQVCLSKKWLLPNHELDVHRFEQQIFNDFSQAKICKTNFD